MRTSDEINEIAAALAKAQGEIEDASKDSKNPHFGSKYADLASVRAAIRGPASKHGLACTQFVRTNGNNVEVETMLMHSSGQYLAETLSLPVAPDKTGRTGPQVFGSAGTYARRYGLMGIFCLAPSEEDDGEGAMSKGNGHAKAGNGVPLTDEQADQIRDLIVETKSNPGLFFKLFGAESTSDLCASDFPRAIQMLEAKKAKLSNGAYKS